MGTDYYLADPDAQEVAYIDRCGVDFSIAIGPEPFQPVDGWPPGEARIISREAFDEVGDLDPEERHPGTFRALSWCAGRHRILLISDQYSPDEKNHDFCHRVRFGEPVPGWKGEDRA